MHFSTQWSRVIRAFLKGSTYVTIEQHRGSRVRGRSPFAEWLDDLTSEAAIKVTSAVARLSQGNFSRVKGLSGGIYECRLDFGPGFRISFGKDGAKVVILLGGGSKRRQDRDIEIARMRWADYKNRKSQEGVCDGTDA